MIFLLPARDGEFDDFFLVIFGVSVNMSSTNRESVNRESRSCIHSTSGLHLFRRDHLQLVALELVVASACSCNTCCCKPS